MRVFYLLKSAQVLLTLFVLVEILSPSELCAPFLSTQVLVQKVRDEGCKSLLGDVTKMLSSLTQLPNALLDSDKSSTGVSRFFAYLLNAYDSITGYGEKESVRSDSNGPTAKPVEKVEPLVKQKFLRNGVVINPTVKPASVNKIENVYTAKRDHGLRYCLKVSFWSVLPFTRASGSDESKEVLRFFAVPIYCALIYLLITLLHALFQQRKVYKFCAFFSLMVGGLCWLCFLLSIFIIDYTWYAEWKAKAEIQPEIVGSIAWGKGVSLVLMLSILCEAFFSKYLFRQLQFKRSEDRYVVNGSNGGCHEEDSEQPLIYAASNDADWMSVHTGIYSMQCDMPDQCCGRF